MKEDTGTLKLNYEHENNCNYLVLEEDKNISEDYQITMLGRNRVNHFLSFDIRRINDMSQVYYDISSKQQLTKLFEYGKLRIDDVKAVCRSLSETVRLAKSYMLDLDRIVMEPRYMYMDMFDKSIWFLYLPTESENDFSVGMRRLFEYILEHFDHSSGKQEVVQLYELYQHILIGDYDPENLLLLFYHEEMEEMHEPNQRSQSIENSNLRQERNENVQLEGGQHQVQSEDEEIEIDSVVREIVDEETEIEDKRAASAVKGIQIFCVVLIIYGMAAMFLPTYVPVRLSLLSSGIMTVLAVGGYAEAVHIGKQVKNLRRFIHGKKEIPYRIRKSEIETNLKPVEAGIERLEKNTQNEAEIQEWNNTVLLSDYLNVNTKPNILKLVLLPSADGYQEQNAELLRVEPDHYPYVIGSMKNLADFVIEKPFISRMHACIQQKEDAYYVEDLNSTNGTYINDVRVEGHHEEFIQDGDRIRLGMLAYKVEIT